MTQLMSYQGNNIAIGLDGYKHATRTDQGRNVGYRRRWQKTLNVQVQ